MFVNNNPLFERHMSGTMPKRRRSVASFGRDDVSDASGTSTTKRRRVPQQDPNDVCQELFDIIRNYKDESGRIICETFIRAPNRRNAPDYHDVVSSPMDFMRMQQKLKLQEYTDVEQMTNDIELMLSNAKSYHKEDTQEYADACALWDLYLDFKKDVTEADDGDLGQAYEEEGSEMTDPERLSFKGELDETTCSSVASGAAATDFAGGTSHGQEKQKLSVQEIDQQLEELFSAAYNLQDSAGREVSIVFRILPSRRVYPEYYDIIDNPIDLKTIGQRVQEGRYRSLEEIEKDLLQMVKNAKMFNKPGSQIYKDAMVIKKTIVSKKAELQVRSHLSKSSERIRSRRHGNIRGMSAVAATLQYPEDEEDAEQDEDEDQCDDMDDDDNDEGRDEENELLQLQLYEAVRNYTNINNEILSEPFYKLPSKRLYPDYYEEIKHPECLHNIHRKIKKGAFGSVEEVMDEINVVFENAKQYNEPGSGIYRVALKLQKMLEKKRRDVLGKDGKRNEPDTSEDETGLLLAPSDARRKERLSISIRLADLKRETESEEDGHKKRAKQAKRGADGPHNLKKNLKALYNTVMDYQDDTGRYPVGIFIVLPSRKDYPDYYQIITDPIDMKMIEANINSGKYAIEAAMVSHFKLMFSNARHYNEEGSQVYRDADLLDRVLADKLKELGINAESPRVSRMNRKMKMKSAAGITDKIFAILEHIKEFTDAKGRVLSSIFFRLPSKQEMPEYYEIIKKPVDLARIEQRTLAGLYDTLSDFFTDFVLMFDNACRFNEPDSQVYKDALTLQKVLLSKKAELVVDDSGIPDVRAAVQELLTNIYVSVINHQNENGRCYSDSLQGLPSLDPDQESGSNKEKQRLLNLEIIKKNLDRGCYRRLDVFQDDMFAVFARGRALNNIDSEIFEDAMELQQFFMRVRDKLCKSGDVLQSPALNITEVHFQRIIQEEKEKKKMQEPEQDVKEEEDMTEKAKDEAIKVEEGLESLTLRDQTYRVGDFVYVEPREADLEPHIVSIEKLWMDVEGERYIYGAWHYRPQETYHLTTRKFLEKEVFRSDYQAKRPLGSVLGKCHVMFVKNYFTSRPEGFQDKDVFVCESRYSVKSRSFKPIKKWQAPVNPHVVVVARDCPLVPTRVPSVFAPKKAYDASGFHGEFMIIDKDRPNVSCNVANPDEGCSYYDQYNIPLGTFKLGDCVYVRSESERPYIARIDRMWTDQSGDPYFHGPWFIHPAEVDHEPTKMFYKREVFLSSVEDTNPMLSITGKCCVLSYRDYTTLRPTEVSEQDVYVCDSRYQEAERLIRKLLKGIKRGAKVSPSVTDDETYYFRQAVVPQKEPSPLLSQAAAEEELDEDGDISMAESETADLPNSHSGTPMGTPASSRSRVSLSSKIGMRKSASGYILFAAEKRKQVTITYPDLSFGEISKIVGQEWRSLDATQKAGYEERAQVMVEASKAEMEALYGPGGPPQVPSQILHPGPGEVAVHECLWQGCDFQFEDQQDLIEHVTLDSQKNGHLQLSAENEYLCYWKDCQRIKRGYAPFPNIQRIMKHVKDTHMRTNCRCVNYAQLSRNFQPSRSNLQSPGNLGGRPLQPPAQPHGTPPQGMPPHPHPYPHPQNGGLPMGYPHVPQTPPPGYHHAPQQNGMPAHYPHPGGITPQGAYMGPPGQHARLPPGQMMPPHMQGVAPPAAPQPPRPPEPMFIPVPPRTQKVLHSEAYIRYIESLQTEKTQVSNWREQMRATPDNTALNNAGKLPVHWLSNGAGNHGNVVNALWALRDVLHHDTLNMTHLL